MQQTLGFRCGSDLVYWCGLFRALAPQVGEDVVERFSSSDHHSHSITEYRWGQSARIFFPIALHAGLRKRPPQVPHLTGHV